MIFMQFHSFHKDTGMAVFETMVAGQPVLVREDRIEGEPPEIPDDATRPAPTPEVTSR